MFRHLRVALLSTGDEVRDPGTALPPGMIYDANRFMLAALLGGLGCEVSDFGVRPDREAALADTLATASAGHDLIVTSGGVSTGEEDHVKPAIERLGSLHFWRLAIKPGRPRRARPDRRSAPDRASGKPGRGASDVCRARPAPDLEKLAGATASVPRLFPVRATASLTAKSRGGAEYVRASLRREGKDLVAVKYPRDGPGIISSITRSEGLVVVGEETSDLAPGMIVDFLPFSEVIG